MKKLDIKLMHPVEQINMVIGRIYQKGMTTTSGGNISIRDKNGDIWITPSAVDKGSLTPNDIVCIKSDGSIVGLHKPSSEYPFHKAIYAARPDINAIIHAHPPGLVDFSITRQVPNTNITPHFRFVCGKVGYAPYGCPGSDELGEKIANQFIGTDYQAVIMENHGVVLGGSNMLDAYQGFETLELCCCTIVSGGKLGKINTLTDAQIEAYKVQIPSKSTEFANPGYPSDELAIRRDIVKIIHRACEQGLMISTFGTVSVRWNENDFLITPHDVSRWNIAADDIIQVKNGMTEHHKNPSYQVALHKRIYEENPHINSIITTQPSNLMAHAITGTKFDVRTIPESWIFLQDIPSIPFGSLFDNIEGLATMFNKNRVVLIENDCVVVTGDQLLNTFDYLEVAEFSANSLVMAASVGSLCPMEDAEIEELRVAFSAIIR